MNDHTQPTEQPWQWSEATWRRIVGRARAGRSMKPAAWPDGARCAVAISFDADHETIPLRDADESPMRISQGQYGNRQGVPRILNALAKHDAKATFFVPTVAALLYPDEQRRVVSEGHEIGIHGWIHELNSQLPYEIERDLMFRSADTLEQITGTRPVGLRTPSWDFSPSTLRIERELKEMGPIEGPGLAVDGSSLDLVPKKEGDD